MAPRLPIGPYEVPADGIGRAKVGSKLKGNGALDLGGHHLVARCINQPRGGGLGEVVMREEARPGWNAWGCIVPSFRATVWNNKKLREILRWLPINQETQQQANSWHLQ